MNQTAPHAENGQRVPPHDLDAERAVLGAMMVSTRALAYVISKVNRDDFYSETYRYVYDGIRAAARENASIDPVVVRPFLEHVPEAQRVMLRIIEGVPTAANADRYAGRVLDCSRARRTLDAASRITERVYTGDLDGVTDYAIGEVQRVAYATVDHEAGGVEGARDRINAWRKARKENKGITGIRTGIGRLDNLIGGLNKRLSYIIAARPNVGKSLVLGQIALTAARQGYRVFIATPEMSKEQYIERMMCAVAAVDYKRARAGDVTAGEDRRLDEAFEELASLPLFFDDADSQTPDRIRAQAMRFEADLLMVDYLQYCVPNPADRSSNRNQEVGAISRELTRIKKALDIPVVMAAQLNRNLELKKGQRPELHHLRDSGEIEQDADLVIFLHRPEQENDDDDEVEDDATEIEFVCRKHRDGETFLETNWLNKRAMWLGPLPENAPV